MDKSIAKKRNDDIKPELIRQIESSGQQLFLWREEQQITPEGLHSEITTEIEKLHSLPVESAQEREERYRALQQTPEYQELKRAFDSWCAAWFWPADELDKVPTPVTFYNLAPSTWQIVDELAAELHFFHWEWEFPDVFTRPEQGFDAVLANPPWETAKPSSKEFFSDYDPLYRTYGKQEALTEQKHLFQHNKTIEHEWLLHQAYFKSMSNWAKHAVSPFGDPDVKGMDTFSLKTGQRGAELHAIWRKRRTHYPYFADQYEPFRYQGSADLNTYKLFLEIAHHMLKAHGYLGMLVPSGIYTDQGAMELRKLFLDQCNWSLLFGFINRQRIFDIHSAFKFAAIQIEKGAKTDQLHVTFNREDIIELEHAEQHLLEFPREQVEAFSPKSLVIVETQTQQDFSILEKLYTNIVLLGDQGINSWQIEYSSEFHMTGDSALFPPFPKWEERGYSPDGYGHWIDDKGNVALPLYEGRMIGPFDPSEKGWVSGKGRSAEWRNSQPEKKVFEPQYLMSTDTIQNAQKKL